MKRTTKTTTAPDAPKGTSRRQFTKAVAATLATAPLVAAAVARAQTPAATKPKESVAPPAPQPSPAQQKPSPLAEAYAEVARVRFSERLSTEQLEQVRKDLEGNVRTAERLRAIKLKNGDEPDFVFSVR